MPSDLGPTVSGLTAFILELSLSALPSSAPLVTRAKHGAQLRAHVGEPGGIGVRVGVEGIETDVLHLVVALGIRSRPHPGATGPDRNASEGLGTCRAKVS